MTANINPFMIPIRDFVGSRQSNLFQTLKQPQFTGELILKSQKEEWIFYLYLGRILYATGGKHTVRRWQRCIANHTEDLISQLSSLEKEMNVENRQWECWEYEVLLFWLEKQALNRQQLIQIIRSIIVEILFDLTQTRKVTFELKMSDSLSTQLVLIDADQVIAEAWQAWQVWQNAKLADRSPNQAPLIKQSEQLKQRTSPKTYEIMSKLFNGENTLRDLNIQLKQNIIQVTRLMIPYLQSGLIELIEIDDISPPFKLPQNSADLLKGKALIVCIYDDFVITEQIKKVVNDAGYQFLSFNNSNQAIAYMLAEKPDFIFLDAEMPYVNGYELCSQLRHISAFREIPIAIMTENLGLIDRVRSKMVGCSDFLLKPINSQALLNLLSKYLDVSA